MSVNKKVAINPLNPPCGTERITLHNKNGVGHSRLIRRSTLQEHGYLLDNERGLLVKVK